MKSVLQSNDNTELNGCLIERKPQISKKQKVDGNSRACSKKFLKKTK